MSDQEEDLTDAPQSVHVHLLQTSGLVIRKVIFEHWISIFMKDGRIIGYI